MRKAKLHRDRYDKGLGSDIYVGLRLTGYEDIDDNLDTVPAWDVDINPQVLGGAKESLWQRETFASRGKAVCAMSKALRQMADEMEALAVKEGAK